VSSETIATNIHLLDQSSIAEELDLVSELFHRINRIIPSEQNLLTIPPTFQVRDAIALMLKHGYSQLPVVQAGEVLGVFSYRSFAREAANVTLDQVTRQKCAMGELLVDEFLEQFEFARVKAEMGSVFGALDRDNGVLIGVPERLIGVLTPMDFLRYLNQVASPFVMVSEIELALRALIQLAFPGEQFAPAAKRALLQRYRDEASIPDSLENMEFGDYKSLIENGANWNVCGLVFGGTRTRVSAKLKEIGDLRNALFHFRRAATLEDHEVLVQHRNWLLTKVKQAQSVRRKESQP
jgi:predicted transcriptional regulator